MANWLELAASAALGALASSLASAYLPIPRRQATFSLARLTPMPLAASAGQTWYSALGVLPPGVLPQSAPTARLEAEVMASGSLVSPRFSVYVQNDSDRVLMLEDLELSVVDFVELKDAVGLDHIWCEIPLPAGGMLGPGVQPPGAHLLLAVRGSTPFSASLFKSAGIYPAGLPIAAGGYAVFTLTLSFDTPGVYVLTFRICGPRGVESLAPERMRLVAGGDWSQLQTATEMGYRGQRTLEAREVDALRAALRSAGALAPIGHAGPPRRVDAIALPREQ